MVQGRDGEPIAVRRVINIKKEKFGSTHKKYHFTKFYFVSYKKEL